MSTYSFLGSSPVPRVDRIPDPWYQAKARGLQRVAASTATSGLGQEDVAPPPPGKPNVGLMVGWAAVIVASVGVFYAATTGVGTGQRVKANRRRRSSRRPRRNARRSSRRRSSARPWAVFAKTRAGNWVMKSRHRTSALAEAAADKVFSQGHYRVVAVERATWNPAGYDIVRNPGGRSSEPHLLHPDDPEYRPLGAPPYEEVLPKCPLCGKENLGRRHIYCTNCGAALRKKEARKHGTWPGPRRRLSKNPGRYKSLSKSARKRMPASSFALPGKRFPIKGPPGSSRDRDKWQAIQAIRHLYMGRVADRHDYMAVRNAIIREYGPGFWRKYGAPSWAKVQRAKRKRRRSRRTSRKKMAANRRRRR